MTEQNVLVKIDERGVATVTMNRPEKHNAFDDGVIAELTRTFLDLSAKPELRAMILAAEGKSFSAGADANWMKRMAGYSYEENLRDANGLAGMLKALNDVPFPTIARVQGAAFGGGVGLVACCDMAIAGPRASFCLSEVKIGLIPATISPYVLDAIGQRASRRYFMTAERFSAEEAARLGLVTAVVEAEQMDEAIDNLINAPLGNSPAAVRAAKQLVFAVDKELTDAVIDDTSERIARIRVSEEGQEGLAAFLEKRPASWIVN